MSRNKSHHIRYAPLVVVGVAGLLISLATAVVLWQQARELERIQFARIAAIQAAAVQNTIERNLELLDSLAALFDASRHVTRDEFARFTRHATERHPEIQALEWIPRVTAAQRAELEARARRDGLEAFEFTEQDAHGHMVRAAPRDHYYPVLYLEPLRGNARALGFDLGSNADRRRAMEQARDSAMPVTTARIRLVQEAGTQFGFLIFYPVYRQGLPLDTVEDRRHALHGFALGVYRAGDLLEHALAAIPAFDARTLLYDDDAAAGRRLLHRTAATPPAGERQADAPPGQRIGLTVPGRSWSLRIAPPAGHAGSLTGEPAAWALLTGLLGTGLLLAYLHGTQRRRLALARSEAALRESEQRLRVFIDHAPVALAMFDTELRYMAVSRRWLADNGLSGQDPTGHPYDGIATPLGAAWDAARERALAGETVKADATRVTPANGQVQWWQWEMRPWRGADGAIGGVVAFMAEVTGQVDAEERNHILSEVVEQSPQPVVITDAAGRIEYVNPSFVDETGYTAAEVRGREAGMLNRDGAPPPELAEAMWERLSRGQAYEGEFHNRRKNGEVYTISALITPIKQADGNISHYVSWQADVSEQKRIARELEDHRHHLEELVQQRTADLEAANRRLADNEFAMNAVGIGIEWFDRDSGRYLYVNRYNAELLGYTEAEMCDMSLWDVDPNFPVERYPEVRENIEQAGTLKTETLHRCRDGRDIPVEVTVHHLPARADTPARFIAFVADISERQAAEARLKHSETLLVEAQRIAQLGHWELTFGQETLVWSDEVYRICEVEPDRFVPSYDSFRQLVHPDDRASLDQALFAAMAGRRHSQVTHRLSMPDGRIKYVVDRAETLFDADGEATRVVGTLQDVTERELTARRLEQALAAAEAATRAKSTFLANMSHEIRTPLNVILGTAELIELRTADAWTRERLGKIGDAGEHLLSIIDDILDLSKIDAGRIELEPVDLRLPRFLDSVAAAAGALAEAKGLKLRFDPPPADLHWLRGDETRLRQCLLNFVGNAVKFTEQGDIRVGVRELERRDGRVLLQFAVTDSGIGIAADAQERLFQDFEQADASTTRRFGGTGLGLAITRRLAELMGGGVGVDSSPGQGSTFWFTAWLEPGTAPRAETAATADASRSAAQPRAQGADNRVLVADDQAANVELLTGFLEHLGLQADIAGNGREALEAVAARDYDLVFMDVQMPLMDGLEATRAIRRLPQRDTLPILALTANASAEDRRQCLAAGMTDFLGKPIQLAALRAALQHWLPSAPMPDGGEPGDDGAPEAALPPGLDPRQGLQLMGQDWGKYLRLLCRMRDDHLDTPRRIADQAGNGDPEGARRLAHALKGTAATVGANRIAEIARDIEQDLVPDDPADAAVLDERIEQLDAAVQELSAWLEAETASD